MKLLLLSLTSSLALATSSAATIYQEPELTDTNVPADEVAQQPLADAPLATHRTELLTLAFRSASSLPLEPHIKNRSRAQEGVVATYVELGQYRAARELASDIVNWRRGAALADLAWALASDGDNAHVPDLVEAAAESIEDTTAEQAQGWRRDRLRTKIARALLASGNPELAAKWSAGAADSEIARLAAEAARTMTVEQAREFLDTIDRVAKTMVFEQVMGTLEVAADLYGMHYADSELRTALEERIKAAWGLLPIGVRLTLLADMASGAVQYGDDEGALRLLTEATELMDSYPWGQMRNHVPLIARLAQGRAEAGDAEGARRELRRGLEVFLEGQAATPDVFQARALRPLAIAAHMAGEGELAGELFALTVEVGLHNPNARPRAEDLAATASEMAAIDFEPGPALWGALRGGLDGLKAPW